ncbi:hypothetical protein GCM10009422_12030 [Brevundimonas kwangchunensis]|uniref:Transposase n=1 Tax=Brevundimonas kwangchunensis TaxID=322163 RepID=A0ABN1GSK0_9CAUL
MTYEDRKIRSDETWERVRREWEAGATGSSLAARYDVGLSNLWRRRQSENWVRRPEPERAPEPVEGWERYGRDRLAAFEQQLEETRTLAVTLAAAMNGGSLKGVPVWHVGFVLDWRAQRLDAEAQAADRAYLEPHEWTHAFWHEDGSLASVKRMDMLTLQANRDDWREDNGIPEGVVEWWP